MKDYLIIESDGNDVIRTDVPHLITLHHSENPQNGPEFKIGYAGHGPNELAANIMWISNAPEHICMTKAPKFRDEVMNLKVVDGRLDKSVINEWFKKNNINKTA